MMVGMAVLVTVCSIDANTITIINATTTYFRSLGDAARGAMMSVGDADIAPAGPAFGQRGTQLSIPRQDKPSSPRDTGANQLQR